jgi:hypothetical protein
MFNPSIQVQIPRDTDLGSYYLKKKHYRGLPYSFPFKKISFWKRNLGFQNLLYINIGFRVLFKLALA